MRADAPDSKADLSSDTGVAVAVRIVTRIRWDGRPLPAPNVDSGAGHVLWLSSHRARSVRGHCVEAPSLGDPYETDRDLPSGGPGPWRPVPHRGGASVARERLSLRLSFHINGAARACGQPRRCLSKHGSARAGLRLVRPDLDDRALNDEKRRISPPRTASRQAGSPASCWAPCRAVLTTADVRAHVAMWGRVVWGRTSGSHLREIQPRDHLNRVEFLVGEERLDQRRCCARDVHQPP